MSQWIKYEVCIKEILPHDAQPYLTQTLRCITTRSVICNLSGYQKRGIIWYVSGFRFRKLSFSVTIFIIWRRHVRVSMLLFISGDRQIRETWRRAEAKAEGLSGWTWQKRDRIWAVWERSSSTKVKVSQQSTRWRRYATYRRVQNLYAHKTDITVCLNM